MKRNLDELIRDFEQGIPFAPQEYQLNESDCQHWVRIRLDPQRFTASIFDGDWANTNQHPTAGNMRLIKIVKGNDGISRIISRQGKYLFAYPWFK